MEFMVEYTVVDKCYLIQLCINLNEHSQENLSFRETWRR